MGDGTVRGEFTLTSEQALRGLRSIRDTGREADNALATLGRRMDEIGMRTIRPRVDLTGIDAANAKLSELEMRLGRLGRSNYSPHVRVGGGFGGGAGAPGQGLVAGQAGSPLFGSLGGLGGRLPWWAMLAPVAPQLAGGAVGLLGSAASAAGGLGVLGLGGGASLAAGAGFTMAVARPAIQALGQITKAQDAYTKAVAEFGRTSTQAATAQRGLNFALAQNPAAAGAGRQVLALRQSWQTATAPARANVYSGVAQVAANARRAMPTLGGMASGATGAVAASAGAFSGFLAQPAEQGMLMQLTGSFARELPVAERSLENMATTFLHLAVAAQPFFHDANSWLERWTSGLARSSADQPRVQQGMREMVSSARDWARLAAAAGRDIRDLFSAGRPSGDSMVVSLTGTLDRWDTWLRDNPQKVSGFFSRAEQGVGRIATVLGNLTRDIAQLFGFLDPILGRAEQFLSFASGLGGGSVLTGALALFAGYRGARGALGGGGPSGAGVLGSVLLGSPVPMIRSRGGVVAGGAAAAMGGAAAAQRAAYSGAGYLMPRAGFQTAGQAGTIGEQLPLFATLGTGAYAYRMATAGSLARGQAAFQARYGGVEGARYAMPESQIGLVPLAERGGVAGMLGKAGSALSGAARVIAPMMAVFAAIQGIGAGATAGGSALHGINVGASSALSTLTFGAIRPTTFQQMFAGAPTGADSRVAPISQSFAGQANAVRSPTDLAALQRRAANIRITAEMSPASAAHLRASVQQALQVGAQNAGAYASNTWESAFTHGLDRGVAPQRAVRQMLGGMQAQISHLGPQGAMAFARDTAAWTTQLQAADPRLQRPMRMMMNGIVADINRMNRTVGDSFRDLQNKVFFFNGQILQGSQVTWAKIRDALVNPASVAQEKLSGIWSQIQQEAIDALTSMGYSRSQARSIVTNIAKPSSATNQAGDIARNTANLTANPSQASGTVLTSSGTTLNVPPTRERGGVIPGQGLLDTVNVAGVRAAPGEAWIANRHTMNALSSATLEKFGKTAWQMIRDEQRPHSAPARASGGLFGNIAGAISNATAGVTNTIARGTGSGWVQRAHPELHPGIAQAVELVLSRFPLSITSTTRGGHASGSYHYLGEAADIAGSSGTMLAAGQWIGSNIAGGLTEGIHNPNLSVKNGQAVPSSFWGPATWAGHANHIHMAVAGALNAAGISGGGGAAGAMPSAIALRAPGSGMHGIPGAMADQASRIYTAGLQQRVNSRLGALGAAGGISAAGWSGGGSNTANQQLGHRMMLSSGWGEDQWPALLALWNQESGWSSTSVNSSSGAYGIPQALGHGHPFNLGDAPAQIAWGLNYIRGRYGSPAAAEAHERAFNWYQRGGRVNWAGWNAKGGSFVTNGPTMFGAGENGVKERVSISPVGRGDGRAIHVIMQNVHLGTGSADELERVAQDVAGRIIDALDRTEGGASDSSLAGVA